MNLRLALTGGIGSGKSTAAAAFAALGATIIDADIIARAVVARGTPGFDAVVARFGSEIIGPDGELDRAALGAIIFADDGARADLNGIVHPAVRDEAARQLAFAHERDPQAITIEDIPLLAETSGAARFHGVIVVHAATELRVERLRGRGLTEADARSRMRAQATDAQRLAIADYVLENAGSVAELQAQIAELWANRILPLSRTLAAGKRLTDSVHTSGSDSSTGAVERAGHRLRQQWGENGLVTETERDTADFRVVSIVGESAATTIMAAAGFVPSAKACFISADPGQSVLVSLEYPS